MTSKFYEKHSISNIDDDNFPMGTQNVPLQCSTRGIGFSVVMTLKAYISYYKPTSYLPHQEMPVFELYRVSLALLETKMSLVNNYSFKDYHFRQYFPVLSLWRMPKMISAIVDTLGSFTRNNIKFVPVMARNRLDDNGLLLPDAGSVYYSNLRSIVCSLSNDRTPLEVRKRFVNENSIPGAKFSADYILENPDDIMPAEGDDDSCLRCDVRKVNAYFSKYEKYIKWLSPLPNLDSGAGMPFCAVATERSVFIPSAPDFDTLYRNGLKYDDYEISVFSPIGLNSTQWLLGSLNFLREPPGLPEARYPFWDGCSESVAPFRAFANILSPNFHKIMFP